jgi:hypothetical protein
MLGGSGTGFDRDRAQRSRAALGEHHTVDTGPIGYAQQGTQILRVFDPVERQQQARLRLTFWVGFGHQQVFKGKQRLRADIGHNALMACGLCNIRELLARLLEHTHTGFAAKGDKVGQPRIVSLAGHQNVIELTPAGAQSLLDRVQAI